MIHRLQLLLDMVTLKQRNRIGIGLNAARMAGHQELHELLGVAKTFLTLDDDFVDVFVIQIADCALDQVAVLINDGRCCSSEGFLADFVPQAREIVEVAANFDLGAL